MCLITNEKNTVDEPLLLRKYTNLGPEPSWDELENESERELLTEKGSDRMSSLASGGTVHTMFRTLHGSCNYVHETN